MGFELLTSLDNIRDVSPSARLHDWIKHFDLHFYRTHGHYNGYPDLLHLSDDELLQHFITTGSLEGRSYNKFFYSFIDPEFYAKKYTELEFSDYGEAIRHWMYYGVYENRIPNIVTQMLVDADIHLFQMGKVGSTTIATAFKSAGYSKLIPHLHWANELPASYPDCFYSYRQLVNFDPNKRLLFISGVREPIERVMSGLFQSTTDPKSSLTIKDLINMLDSPQADLDKFLAPHFNKILGWFEHGYYRGIDVYAYPFDCEKGYAVVEKGCTTIFLYRLDALDKCWPALCEVAGISAKLVRENQSQDKAYGEQLLKWREKATFRSEFLEAVRNSKYFRHFFGPSDL